MTAPILLSIGLNVGGSEPPAQLSNTLAAVSAFGRVLSLAVGRSQWEGVPERFLQVLLSAPRHGKNIAAELAGALNQDCIGLFLPAERPNARGQWLLIYADGRAEVGGSEAEFPVLAEIAL